MTSVYAIRIYPNSIAVGRSHLKLELRCILFFDPTKLKIKTPGPTIAKPFIKTWDTVINGWHWHWRINHRIGNDLLILHATTEYQEQDDPIDFDHNMKIAKIQTTSARMDFGHR